MAAVREVVHHPLSLHVRQVAVVVSRVQVNAGGGLVGEEQLALQLRVDLYLAADQGVFGRESSV